jgi:hypothetical protein
MLMVKEHNYSIYTEDDPKGSIENRAFSILPTKFGHAAKSVFMLILEHSSQFTLITTYTSII